MDTTTLEIPHSVMTLAEALVQRGGLHGNDYCRLVTRARWAGKKQGVESTVIIDAAIALAQAGHTPASYDFPR